MLSFEEAYLKLKGKMYQLFAKQVSYQGHIFSGYGISTDLAKVGAVYMLPVPQQPTDLRGFLGTYSYYQRFVPGHAELVRQQNVIGSKYATFIWSPK